MLFSRRACTSWRFVAVDGHKDHLPGECPKCWVACGNVLSREQWADGIRRCEECVESLVHCPILQVRKALVDEKDPAEDVLATLVTDSYGPVSMKARRLLDDMRAARSPQPELAYGAVQLELPVSPRRAHRQQQALAAATPKPQPALTAPRQSVWDQ
ncbi:MAG: hypothetical protein J0J04_07720 [Microbacterium sp.]|uniref:hypothetical protein n=1 Tax=Microbacterium sp. TaxID=51671 RepID=UPI001AC49365|nr:hypothetical protein [Microbacterium sp.]MBN9214686.1 hypothetical protein [Microbacterium sp.]